MLNRLKVKFLDKVDPIMEIKNLKYQDHLAELKVRMGLHLTKCSAVSFCQLGGVRKEKVVPMPMNGAQKESLGGVGIAAPHNT